jgi:hypothetical protein
MNLRGKIAVALGAWALACTAIANARADDVPTLILATALPPGNPLANQVLHP